MPVRTTERVTRSVTVSVVLALTPEPSVAAIVAVPAPRPVARPPPGGRPAPGPRPRRPLGPAGGARRGVRHPAAPREGAGDPAHRGGGARPYRPPTPQLPLGVPPPPRPRPVPKRRTRVIKPAG